MIFLFSTYFVLQWMAWREKGGIAVRLLRSLLIVGALFILFFEIQSIHDVKKSLDNIESQFKEYFSTRKTEERKERDSIELSAPVTGPFSIASIELGMDKKDVEKRYGTPVRTTINEYDTYWHTFHKDYRQFFMVTYDEHERVVGLYTNQNLISSVHGIQQGTRREEVLEKLGAPLSSIRKDKYIYQLPDDRNYDLFHVENCYITIFYDEQQDETVRAMQIIDEKLEQERRELYVQATAERIEALEYQLFDLVNAERKKYGLNLLSWDSAVQKTARKHSEDMAVNGYFNHTNLAGKSAMERLQEDNIIFRKAGENLAYGQWSAIFAHEGLMNSPGHRANILEEDYEYLGIGVYFNDNNEPFFTQNFYR